MFAWSKLEHLRDMGSRPVGLLRKEPKKSVKPLSRKKIVSLYKLDNRETSVRKASEVPGASKKVSNNRMAKGGKISTREKLKDYQLPRQDKNAFSLKYKKTTYKKASDGSKLGLKGMGQMQDKAPQPIHYTDRSRRGLLLKRKRK